MKNLVCTIAMIFFFNLSVAATDDGGGNPKRHDACNQILATDDGGGKKNTTKATDDGGGKPNSTNATDDGGGIDSASYLEFLQCIDQSNR